MKQPLSVIASFLLSIFLIQNVYSAEMSGRQIVDEVNDRHEQPYEMEEQSMDLISRSGDKETRKVRRFSRKGKNKNFKYLITFLQPKGIRGTALLTWQHKEVNKDDDQWLYLPAYGNKLKRIAKGGRKNYFMGTDYTYEDMISESRDNFQYEILADEQVDGHDLYVIKATPNNKKTLKNSGYSYRVLKIRKDIFFVVETAFYDKRGRLLKNQYNNDLENIKGAVWRANTSIMDNIKKKHKTVVHIRTRNFSGKSVPEKTFKKRFITSKKHIR